MPVRFVRVTDAAERGPDDWVFVTADDDPAAVLAVWPGTVYFDLSSPRHRIRSLLGQVHRLSGHPWPATPRTHLLNSATGLCHAWLEVSESSCTPEQWAAYRHHIDGQVRKVTEPLARGLAELFEAVRAAAPGHVSA
jgi:hypothetical protein